jgi:hypothetical protein
MTESSVEEIYVKEYHSVLDKLKKIGIETVEFRVDDSLVKQRNTGGWKDFGSGETHTSYSKEKYVERAFLLTKIDTVLGYFEILTSEKPKSIGFNINRD